MHVATVSLLALQLATREDGGLVSTLLAQELLTAGKKKGFQDEG